jgi:TDG/mug DNA glycosylase family protein
MDADIRLESATPNDFRGFFAAHPDIERIGFNGQKAAQLFGRLVQNVPDIERIVLPSTSPAYASMRIGEKLRRWRAFTTVVA